MLPLTNYGIKCMSMGFLVDPDSAIVWRGLMVMSAIGKLLRQVAWGNLDYLLIDMPPGTGDVQLSISQNIPVSGAVIVTTPQEIALIDAKKGIVMFEKVGVPILGLVENMSYHECDGCSKKHFLFGQHGAKKLAEESGTQLLGELPIDINVMKSADSGRPFIIEHPSSATTEIYKGIATKIVKALPLPLTDHR